MQAAALALMLVSLARADMTDRNRYGYEEVAVLGWNDACSVALRHYRYPPFAEGAEPEPVAGRVGAVVLKPDSALPRGVWTLEVKEGTLWDRAQAAAAHDALTRIGFTRQGLRERLRKEPAPPGGPRLATFESTASLRVGYAVPIPSAPYSLSWVDYSPLGNCAFLLYEKQGRPPGVYRYQLVRIPLDVRRERAQAHLKNAELLYRKGEDTYGSLDEAEIAAGMDPRLGEARYRYAMMLALHGRFDEALRELREAVVIDPAYGRQAKEAVEFDDLHGQPRFKKAIEPPKKAIEPTKSLIPIDR